MNSSVDGGYDLSHTFVRDGEKRYAIPSCEKSSVVCSAGIAKHKSPSYEPPKHLAASPRKITTVAIELGMFNRRFPERLRRTGTRYWESVCDVAIVEVILILTLQSHKGIYADAEVFHFLYLEAFVSSTFLKEKIKKLTVGRYGGR